ncbi:MAG: helix-turn-helix domain-containing protein [Alphaproteobacteria bacterium]|nr:helix-turn-helix domain-containing protein [Alphaproteobacteria bacterium]
MGSSKIFAGARLRRMRNSFGLNQAALAQSLGISPSYLNLIERDQRPITAQLLLKLHMLHGADIAELSGTDERSDVLASLREVVADPLLNGEIPVATELTQAQDVAPNLVGATIKLYGAYREVLTRLIDMSQQIAASGSMPTTTFETVHNWLQDNPWHQPLEDLAEEVWFDLTPKDDVYAGIKARLRAGSGIDLRIIPIEIMKHDRAHYDRHSQRLLISERLSGPERLFEAALLLARLEGKTIIDAVLKQSSFAANAESSRLLQLGLMANFATSILCPAAKFSAAQQDLKSNVEAMSSRFNASAAQIMKRMAALGAREGRSIGFLQVDAAGAVRDRIGKTGFLLPHSGALCGHLPHFTGEHVVKLETTDGKSIVMVAKREHHLTSALCFSSDEASKTIYTPHNTRPLGATCRLCDIKNCQLRREPPATRPAALNEFVRGPTDFEPV